MEHVMKEFELVSIERIEDRGATWYEASSNCGHTIAVTFGMQPGLYEVQVSGPTENRHYSGPEYSEAHKVHDGLIALYREYGP
jgi:hypothetical protein